MANRGDDRLINKWAAERGQKAFDLQQSQLVRTRRNPSRAWLDYDAAFGAREARWQMGMGGMGMLTGIQAMGYNATGYSGDGLGYAADPMLAQMGSSSNMGGGSQDLYIANANIGSTNLQDLFYNTDQLGT